MKRSALILTVTAWESFLEDTVTEQLETRLRKACDPSEQRSVFNSVAHEWLTSAKPERLVPDLVHWTGDGWKDMVRKSLADSLEAFHSPKSENTNRLFDQYLGISICEHWFWKGVSKERASRQLDELITLRGRVTHRGVTRHPASRQEPSVLRSDVVKALNLVYNLVDATERALGVSPSYRPFDT